MHMGVLMNLEVNPIKRYGCQTQKNFFPVFQCVQAYRVSFKDFGRWELSINFNSSMLSIKICLSIRKNVEKY